MIIFKVYVIVCRVLYIFKFFKKFVTFSIHVKHVMFCVKCCHDRVSGDYFTVESFAFI